MQNQNKNCLILVRHGQSVWNEKNLFTGWIDIGLTEKGKKQVYQTGLLIKKANISIDHAFSSALKRSIHSLEILLQAMGKQTPPFEKDWRLNERHYGALQGKNKEDIKKEFGAKQVQEWRRSFKTAPPPLEEKQNLNPKEFYKNLTTAPKTESLQDTSKRVLSFWNEKASPLLKKGENVLLVAHGNSLRALIKELESLSDSEISSIELQTGQAFVYELDDSLGVLNKMSLKTDS